MKKLYVAAPGGWWPGDDAGLGVTKVRFGVRWRNHYLMRQCWEVKSGSYLGFFLIVQLRAQVAALRDCHGLGDGMGTGAVNGRYFFQQQKQSDSRRR